MHDGHLHHVQLPFVAFDVCKDRWNDTLEEWKEQYGIDMEMHSETQFCAGNLADPGLVDACNGDSGGK